MANGNTGFSRSQVSKRSTSKSALKLIVSRQIFISTYKYLRIVLCFIIVDAVCQLFVAIIEIISGGPMMVKSWVVWALLSLWSWHARLTVGCYNMMVRCFDVIRVPIIHHQFRHASPALHFTFLPTYFNMIMRLVPTRRSIFQTTLHKWWTPYFIISH